MRLTRESLHRELAGRVSAAALANHPERVIQFGEGNFLRAFADWHFHELNQRGLFAGRVVVVQPRATGSVVELNRQGGVYTLLQRGLQDGQPVERAEIITSVSRGLNPYADWPGFLACAANPDLRFMVSNTTEAGIVYTPTPRPTDQCPASFPAKVAFFLHERFQAFHGATDKGLVILPCELIEQNGDALKQCVLQHAADWALGSAFTHWLETSNAFCNTLVDRIVSGFPKEEAPALAQRFGYEDALLVVAEPFHLWVIQAPPFVREELRFTEAGLNSSAALPAAGSGGVSPRDRTWGETPPEPAGEDARVTNPGEPQAATPHVVSYNFENGSVIWTDDLRPYRTLKVRILNGAHTLFSLAAFLAGHDTVRASLEDPLMAEFVQRGVFDEILPTLDFPAAEKIAFARTVLERFRNPFLQHPLLSVALNSVSKFRVRVLPSLLASHAQTGQWPPLLTFSLAALLYFYRIHRQADGRYVGQRNGQEYPVQDDPDVLAFFAEQTAQSGNTPATFRRAALALPSFWGEDLTSHDGLTETVTRHVEAIFADGLAPALQRLL